MKMKRVASAPVGFGKQLLDAEEEEQWKKYKKTSLTKREIIIAGIRKRLPFLNWLPNYNCGECFLSDMIGGVTIGMVCMAQTLAHAAIATTTPIQGPYCAFVPAFVYAFMGTSPHASVSSGAIAAIVIADQLRPWPDEYDRTQLASLLALISGIVLIAIGFMKLSFAVRFLSQPTISGFVTGGSLLIVTQQFKNLLGFLSPDDCRARLEEAMAKGRPIPECHPFPHTDQFPQLCEAIIAHLPHADWISVVLGIILMVALDGFNRLREKAKQAIKSRKSWGAYAKRVAEMKEIICVITACTFAYFTTVDGDPIVTTIGKIPAGLPPFHVPWDIDTFSHLLKDEIVVRGMENQVNYVHSPNLLKHFLTGGALVAFTTFLTTFATCKKMAIKCGYPLDPAQEMIGLGCAGVSGSFFGAFPPSGSLSRTGLADECGVKTQMGGVFCAAVIGLGLTCLTPVLEFLPRTTLAAIIITSTRSLIDFGTPRKLFTFWKPDEKGGLKRDFITWCLAFFFTVFCGVLEGIAIAVLFSVVLVVGDAAAPPAVVLGKVDDGKALKWRNVKDWDNAKIYPGVLIFEFRGPLSFANSEYFEEQFEKMRVDEETNTGDDINVVIISMQSVHQLDWSAINILREVCDNMKKNRIRFYFAEAKHRVRTLIESELKDYVEKDNLMVTIDTAVEMARRDQEQRGMGRLGSRTRTDATNCDSTTPGGK